MASSPASAAMPLPGIADRASGLDYLFMDGGASFSEADLPSCLTIANMPARDTAIASAIVSGPYAIRGMECRFLRSWLGLPRDALAHLIGMTVSALLIAEGRASQALPLDADKALRRLVAWRRGRPERFWSDDLKEISKRILVARWNEDKRSWHASIQS